jgi:ABC-2 type transport system permease protein
VTRVRRVTALLGNEARLIARDPISLVVLIGIPIVTMTFLVKAFEPALRAQGYAHANGAEQVVPGQATMQAFYVVALTTFAFFAEHGWITWDRLRASQLTSIEIIIGKSVPRVLLVLAQFAVVFTFGIGALHLHVRGQVVALVPLVAAYSICLVLIGVAVTAICRTAQQASAIAFVGMVLLGAVGGAFVPTAYLPGWAKSLGPVTPTYWTMRGFNSVILSGHGLSAVTASVAVLLAIGVACALLAATRLRFDSRKVAWA